MRLCAFALLSVLLLIPFALAESTSTYSIPAKLTAAETQDAPKLSEASVYPMWGQPCMNFTYRAAYSDSKGRAPEYVRINLNGQWHDMQEQSGNYSSGALYTYNYIPTSGKQLFYYFEASNGAGKARAGMIDSPDQGPVLHSETFDNNQLALFSVQGASPLWQYPLGKEMVSAVALSKDGKYAAAATPVAIYLVSADTGELVWRFCKQCKEPALPMPEYAGAAISADGNYVAATIKDTLYYFGRESGEPIWTANIESNAIGVAMSADGQRVAVGVGNAGPRGDKIIFFGGSGEKLGEYKSEQPGYVQTGNFYRPSMTPDGGRVAATTGCPDRRAYLFTGEGKLVFRSSMLTEDSPVHKSSISADGSLIAYSADHSAGKEIVFLLDGSGRKLWGFSSQADGTARAVSISSNGNYVAAGTSAGNVYLFSKASSKPLWKFSSTGSYRQIGEVKLSPDGSYLAAGGTTKKVYLFSKSNSKPIWEGQMSTWVNGLDFNGELVLAGTGMLEYMFEGNSASPVEVSCKQVIQPPPIESMGLSMGLGNDSMSEVEAVCGNAMCEPGRGESWETCPRDCMQFDDGDGQTGKESGDEIGDDSWGVPDGGSVQDWGAGSQEGPKDAIVLNHSYSGQQQPPQEKGPEAPNGTAQGAPSEALANNAPQAAPEAPGTAPSAAPVPQQPQGIIEAILGWLAGIFGG